MLVRSGRLPGDAAAPTGAPTASAGGATATVTYHDPCYLGRHNGVYDEPRRVVEAAGATQREMPRHRERSFCCGAGGAQFWKEEEPGERKVADARVEEARATGASVIAAGCPFCKVMLGSAEGAPVVKDVAQLLEERLMGAERGAAADAGAAAGG
jgi:Fe-S oxidoreductase